jgi:hypothetical protein
MKTCYKLHYSKSTGPTLYKGTIVEKSKKGLCRVQWDDNAYKRQYYKEDQLYFDKKLAYLDLYNSYIKRNKPIREDHLEMFKKLFPEILI